VNAWIGLGLVVLGLPVYLLLVRKPSLQTAPNAD
jgi:hypothetical protein